MASDKQKAIVGLAAVAAIGIGVSVVGSGGDEAAQIDAGVPDDSFSMVLRDDAGHLTMTDLLTEEVEKGEVITAEVVLDDGYVPKEPVFSAMAFGCFTVLDITMARVDTKLHYKLKARNECTKRRLTAFVPLEYGVFGMSTQ